MDRLFQDLRFAARLLWKDRGFSTTTLATLALCIAANAAIFAIVNAVLLKPLPFEAPDRLIILHNAYPGAGVLRGLNGVPDYFDRRAQMPALESLGMYRVTGVTLGSDGTASAERVPSMLVTPSLFGVLRVDAARGRLFTEEDGEVGQDRKVVLSEGLWQRRFAGRSDAVGSSLRINGELYTVVGVMPASFRFVDPDVQLWRPAAFSAADRADDRRHSNNWQQVARLRAGSTVEEAQAQVDAINAVNLDRFPAMREALTNAGFRTAAVPLHDDLVAASARTLYLLWGGALFVLIIGCVNIANLVSVRASARVRELATRHALGASFERLSRQLLTETMLLAMAGGAAGLVLGVWALAATQMLGFDQLPRGGEIALDGRALAFTFVLVCGVGVSVSLLPIAALRRANLALIVREEGRSGTASRGARLMRRGLVTCQVAFALMLLIGAGLLLASFERVLAVDPGFEAGNVLTGSVSLPDSRYPNQDAVLAVMARLLERIRTVPGVADAGFTTTLPVSGEHSDSVILAEGYQMAPGESLISPSQVRVTPGYFEAMGTELKRGRLFDERDRLGAPRVIIVDERLAQKFWPGQDPIGRRMYLPDSAEQLQTLPPIEKRMTVVGVVENVRYDGLVDGAGFRTVGAYYLPLDQSYEASLTLAVRTPQDPLSLIGSLRAEIAAVDPELPFYAVRTMDENVTRSLVDRRTPMLLATSFAAVALLLAAIGIYGVLAYQVAQRRREIGIRMALGAATPSIFGMVLGEGALMVGAGTVLGLGGAFLLRRTLQSQLYEVAATDPRVIAAVAAILVGVALIACLLPARKAARTDPVAVLHA